MTALPIECVPNVSEGRDPAVIRHLERAIRGVDAVHLLDAHTDRFHNRTVFTFAGPPAAATEAAFELARAAVDAIDLTRHAGEHPRRGAIDVIPFVPLGAAGMAPCVRAARALGKRLGEELGVPVFLYGEAAAGTRPSSLPAIRAALAGTGPGLPPDFGPRAPHPTAGVATVGARGPLVAFNVLLDTADRQVAGAIAREIRASSGGLPGIRALGFVVDGRAQVSMNLVDPLRTGTATAYGAVAELARRHGVEIVHSEIVGLAPRSAVPPDAARSIRLNEAPEHKVLEARLRAVGLEKER